jgi:hypothetical protein
MKPITFKITAPTILETFIYRLGIDGKGHAFSVRDVECAFFEGELILMDLKIYNRQTLAEIVLSPEVRIKFNWPEIFKQDYKIGLAPGKLNLYISSDTQYEISLMNNAPSTNKYYLKEINSNVSSLKVIEEKKETSPMVVEINDLKVQVKDITPTHLNKTQLIGFLKKAALGLIDVISLIGFFVFLND